MSEQTAIVKPNAEQIAAILASHKLWLEAKEGGKKANLSYADLRSANLSYADLRSANLRSANLSYADLSYADLSYADLRSANLRSANLSYADLRSANLSYANLRSANLSSANLPAGESWETYLAEVLPQLLSAGSKTLEEVMATGAWDCHTWQNCPMHEVFGAESEHACPALYRPRVREFIQFFDANLIVAVRGEDGKWMFKAREPEPSPSKDETQPKAAGLDTAATVTDPAPSGEGG